MLSAYLRCLVGPAVTVRILYSFCFKIILSISEELSAAVEVLRMAYKIELIANWTFQQLDCNHLFHIRFVGIVSKKQRCGYGERLL